jgi:hypothetical protein
VTLSDLVPNQVYHYRVVATNEEGDRVYGADQEFRTETRSPSVIHESAVEITETDSELEAEINPNNEPTTYYFRYSTSPTLVGATTVPTSPAPEVGAGFEEYRVRQDIGGGLLPNTTYYFQVVAMNATNTTEGPVEAFTTLARPVAETEVPTFVTETTATLMGTVTTQDKPTRYTFQYVSQLDFESSGFTDATTLPQPEGYVGASIAPVAVSAVAGGLTPDTTYRVRLLADNPGGFREGSELIFTTVVLPPEVSTGQVVNATVSAATVNGGVNPEHGDTKYIFEYVDEDAFQRTGYQDATSVPQPEGEAPASGESEIVTATLTGLTPDTVYHYRLVAANFGGRREGTEKTLETPTEDSSAGTPGSTLLFGAGDSVPLPGLTYPDLGTLRPAPAPVPNPVGTPKPRGLSCANAKRIKNAGKRRAALKRCGEAKGKGKVKAKK